MNFKKVKLISLFSLLFSILSTRLVTAAEPWDSIRDVIQLDFLGKIGLQNTGDPIEGAVRFLILIVLFAVLFKTSERILNFGKNISIVIALAISFISILAIPGPVLLAIAKSYSLAIILIVLAFPIVLGSYAYFFLKDHHWLRFVIIAGLVLIIHQLQIHIDLPGSSYASILEAIKAPINWLLVVFYFLGGLSLFQAINGIAGHQLKHGPELLKKVINLGPKTAESIKEKGEKEQAKREAKGNVKDTKKKIKFLNAIVGFMVKAMNEADKINDYLKKRSLENFKKSKKSLKNIKEHLKNSRKQLRKTRRHASGDELKSIEMIYAQVEEAERFVDKFEKEHYPDDLKDPDSDTLILAAKPFPNNFRLRCGVILEGLQSLLKGEKVKMEEEKKEETREERLRNPPREPY